MNKVKLTTINLEKHNWFDNLLPSAIDFSYLSLYTG